MGDEEQVDGDDSWLMESRDDDPTRGEGPVCTPTGVSACGKTREIVACGLSGNEVGLTLDAVRCGL